ncbi:hypothetical protein EB796_021518 [Bugula neritina]|uniref:Uncharacterized protein n=1 Tax=Bugula neritina TaxID=10212 RepID=A0A7J7J242_BUGNE|nr:hypothetical protein EB796_021518 [Bugula neritina]
MEAVKADHTDSLNQLENEYKIVLDAVQSEKQEVEDSLMKVTEEYSSLKNSLENDEALALVSLRQDLESLHKEEMDELRSEYDTAIASLTERHQEEVAKFQVDIEAQSNELLKESLEQKQADVKAVIKEYEAKVEETQAKMRQEYDMVLEEMRLQCERDIETEKQALASRVDLDEAQQKADDLDAAHVEELKILADEHDLQLQQLRDKLASQLDAMSTELSDLQANHEGELLQLRAAHNKLMEEALLEQHNNTEQDILLRNEAMESEREAWEAEREAHEAEVQALEHQINLERQEYKSKVEAHSSVVRDLEKQLLNERTLAKETSSIWIDKMSELQTEQEHRNQEYKDSLSDIEKTYQKQIDSLKEHLQRIVTESHQKDDLIEQLKAEKAKLQDQISTSSDSKDLISQLQLKAEKAKLQDQISTSSDSKDLISQLQVDLDHLKQEKESIGATNQKLLELLSNNVETHRSLESHILKRIGPVDGFSQSGRSTPVNRPQRPNSTAGNGNVGGASNIGGASNMGGASSRGDASTPTPHEKSFDSEMADEGLDLSHMSHTREASMFVGPSLQFSEEETVIESGRHLQEVVDMLLSRIENVNAELEEARREQVEIFQKLSDKTTQVTTLESELKRSDAAATEIGEQLDQALEENTYLKSSNGQQQEVVTELQHTESDLSQELSETKEKLESLEKQYAIIQSDLLTLQNERDAVEEMKRHVEMQYQALSNDATDSESQLITLNSQLATEKVQIQSEYESRVTEYEEKLKSLEEQLLESAKEQDSKVNALLSQQRDLELMVESLEKNLNRDKQFYEQQTMERETERDEHASVANLLKETLDKCKSQEELIADLQSQLSHTVEELHSTAISQIAGAQESLDQSQLTRAELDDKDDTIADMKKMMDSLEAELQTSIHRESDLRQKLDSLQKTSPVDQTTYEEPPQLTQHNVISELSERLEESLKAIQILKEERDNLTDQMEALKNLSEEYMQEKATLQNSVYEHLNDISMLKSQLEALRHQNSSKPGETSRAEALVEELHVLQDKWRGRMRSWQR